MSYYLYAKPDGFPDVSEHPLNPDLFPGYQLSCVMETRPDVGGKRFVDGEWLEHRPANGYAIDRRKAYPGFAEQLDMIWHAMDSGAIPKADAFYAAIKAVKDAHPKEPA